MKVCPKCGMPFDDDLINCKRCDVELLEMPKDEAMSQAEINKKKKRDWVYILIGVPLFMILLYFIYNIIGSSIK